MPFVIAHLAFYVFMGRVSTYVTYDVNVSGYQCQYHTHDNRKYR